MRAPEAMFALLCFGLASCSDASTSDAGDLVYTGGATWTGEWVRCDRWEAGTIARCSKFLGSSGPEFISAVGDFLLSANLDFVSPDGRDGDLVYSFLGNTLHVGPKGVYLLPLNVRHFLYGEEVGFTVATGACRSQLRAGSLWELWRTFSPMQARGDVEQAFERFVRDPEVSGRATTFALLDYSAGTGSQDRWVSMSWRGDGSRMYRGMLLGDCWGSFSTKPAP